MAILSTFESISAFRRNTNVVRNDRVHHYLITTSAVVSVGSIWDTLQATIYAELRTEMLIDVDGWMGRNADIKDGVSLKGDNNKETPKDFLIETPPKDNKKEVGRKADTKLEETEPSCEWKLYTDGASSSDGSGAGLVLIDPKGKEYTYAQHFEFETTNNEA
ncbi:reverse transcriptase domain-containing protein [Tanacetum coccineum]|uniref:Reverse transcriptase domain-containing protein n=1 Tax=Tanacetum coccineum TaxID=301880 RepID=A0ABQ5AEZ9_9ASTR